MRRDITLLWGLRSRCAVACLYCYFGTVEEHKASPPDQLGILSHISRNDLSREEIIAFARTLEDSPVERVVIAGGEPLDWPAALDLIEIIKNAGCEVVIATNGIPSPGRGSPNVSSSFEWTGCRCPWTAWTRLPTTACGRRAPGSSATPTCWPASRHCCGPAAAARRRESGSTAW
ncbi:radical SAM protein [Streptomyces sp. FXJ1.4098]|nr:radical SAM protein [Streptomyces sp. FXJ1.4098]